MITGVTDGKTLPSEVIDQLVVKTDGVPLFVEELTKTVLESGWLNEDANRYELRGPLPALEIPTTLQDSLMARLDRLALGKMVAQLAATIGRQFSYDLLRALAPWDDTTLHQGLRQLVEAELCYRRGLLPQATYMFKHALIRDAAYDSLLRARRHQIHGQIARILEHDPRGIKDREPETIAYHFEAAQEIERAIVYWESAGQLARQRSANQEAATHFIHAIDLLSSMGEHIDKAELELRLRLALGGQLIACYGNGAPEVEENYERAQALLGRVHDRQLTFQARHGLRTFSSFGDPYKGPENSESSSLTSLTSWVTIACCCRRTVPMGSVCSLWVNLNLLGITWSVPFHFIAPMYIAPNALSTSQILLSWHYAISVG
jgi:predicted ATPase